MNVVSRSLQKAALPVMVFIMVVLVHILWINLFPEQNSTQGRWASVLPIKESSWIDRYIQGQNYWLGYSYALSLAFTVSTFRRFRERNSSVGKTLALGSLTFSGFIAFAGCFLLGCCGSPMLAVYLSLFGAGFLPLAKPLIAVLTTGFVGISWCWMNRSKSVHQCCDESGQNFSCSGS